MAKRERKSVADRVVTITKELGPCDSYEKIKILKAAAILAGVPEFNHRENPVQD